MAHRHKRKTPARRTTLAALVAGPLALLSVGAAAVTVGATSSQEAPTGVVRSEASDTGASRAGEVSRSDSRLAAARGEQYVLRLQDAYERRQAREATREAVRRAHVRLWTTAPLTLWTSSRPDARQVGLVEERTRVLVTGRRGDDRAEIVVDGAPRWVTAAYLSPQRPPAPQPAEPRAAKRSSAPEQPSGGASQDPSPSPSAQPSSPGGLSTAPCPDSGVEDGLTSSAVAVYRAVCHAFPEVDTYLGWDAHGEHASGKAIDIMTSDKALGDRIAAFLQSHASALDLYDVIWWDRIWTPVRASEGWRDYGDHGSPTANHMDHVHVSTN